MDTALETTPDYNDLKTLCEAQAMQLLTRDEDIKLLQEKIRHLEMKLFGPSSDKRAGGLDSQGELFVLDEDEEVAAKPDPDSSDADDADDPKKAAKPRRKYTGRKPLPEHLPRVDNVVDLDQEEKICCGKEMKHIGVDEREVLECIPAIFFVVRHLVHKYTCNRCNGENGCHGAIATADTPARILPGSSAGNSVVAEVVTNKMVDGLPGYRQAKRFERFGLTLSRRTYTNWLLSVAKKCHVLDKHLRQAVLESSVIQMDETYFQVMNEEGRKDQTKSYMWVMRSVEPTHRLVYYLYHPTRASAVPCVLLDGFRGVVQTDGYKGYDFLDALEFVILVACFAHVRRKFSDIVKASSRKKGKPKSNSTAAKVLKMIRELYAIERQAADYSIEERLALRIKEAKPKLAILKAFLEEHVASFPEQSLTGKAIRYTLRLWPRLVRYADSGIIPIDNNGVENTIRPFVVGRKNWLFAGSPQGAIAMATLYSLLESAKANGWEPFAYCRFLFDHLPNAVSDDELKNLLPHIAQPISATSLESNDRQSLYQLLAQESPSV